MTLLSPETSEDHRASRDGRDNLWLPILQTCDGRTEEFGDRSKHSSQCFVAHLLDLLTMPCERGIHGADGVPCPRRPPVHVPDIGQDAIRPTVPPAVPSPATPPARRRDPPTQPCGGTLPALWYCMLQVKDVSGRDRAAVGKQPLLPAGRLTEPGHLGRVQDALTQGFLP